MNRLTKFRLWSKERSVMIYPNELGSFEGAYTHENGYLQTIGIDIALKKQDKCVLNQYTGLKDKNEREIYVGDIVNVNKYGGTPNYQEVKYYTAAGYASLHPFQGDGRHWTAFQCEVVSNIYENPELLGTEL